VDLELSEWKQQIDLLPNSQIIDVRTKTEFQKGHILGSTIIDIKQLDLFIQRINQLDKSKVYFVYCKAGVRGAQACRMMSRLQNLRCYNLKGGLKQWTGPIHCLKKEVGN